MGEYCIALRGIMLAAAPAVAILISWALENWAPFARWWARLPDWRGWCRRLLYAAFTLVLGFIAWVIGQFVLTCPDWPALANVIQAIVIAALSWLSGSYRYEREGRKLLQARVVTTPPLLDEITFDKLPPEPPNVGV